MEKKVPSLQELCSDEYLIYLAKACSSFINLSRINSSLLKKTTENILPCLKNQLNTQLSGGAGGIIREEMMEKVLKGRSWFLHNIQRDCVETGYNDIDSVSPEILHQAIQIRDCGRSCTNLCCTGAYVRETMACVLVNEQIKELVFDFSAEKRHWWSRSRPEALTKHINCDFPSILSHYFASLMHNDNADLFGKTRRSIALRKLVISGTGLKTREFADEKAGTYFLFNYNFDALEYFNYPGLLSSSLYGSPDSEPTQIFSDDLMGVLSVVFNNFGKDSFAKLTEIQLGPELSNKSIGDNVGARLFHGIGMSCPSIKVFDLSATVNLPTEYFIHLFFHDAYHSLHKYAYQAPWYEDKDDLNKVCVKDDGEPSEYFKHTHDKYCPFCLDQWARNGLRMGCYFFSKAIPVIDDRLYNMIEKKYPDKAGKYLVNVVKATDLTKSLRDPDLELVRPFPHYPTDADEVAHGLQRDVDAFADVVWYPVDTSKPVKYQPITPRSMNPVCLSLQVLKLGHLGPRHEIVPFLLKALPNVKTLGSVNVLNGLKMYRDITGDDLDNIGAQLSDVTIDIVTRESGPNKLTASSWASAEIRTDINQFFDDLDPSSIPLDKRREILSEDMKMVTRACPNLRSLSLFIFSSDFPGLLAESETWIWESLKTLDHLNSLTLIGHQWAEVSALFSVIGARLGKLCLSLNTRSTEPGKIPHLDQLLQLCPDLHTLKVDFRLKPISTSSEDSTLDLSKLTKVSLGLSLSKKAFTWLCERAPNLEEILVPAINSPTFLHNPVFWGEDSPQEYFDKEALEQIFNQHPMKQMKKFNVHMLLSNISAATFLVETLRRNSTDVEEIGKLTIQVELPNNNDQNHVQMLEDTTLLIQRMKAFKQFCRRISDKNQSDGPVTMVKFEWKKVGLFQLFENQQLNDIVDPNEMIVD